MQRGALLESEAPGERRGREVGVETITIKAGAGVPATGHVTSALPAVLNIRGPSWEDYKLTEGIGSSMNPLVTLLESSWCCVRIFNPFLNVSLLFSDAGNMAYVGL
ncbi:hypothetical protein KM043_014815 [Ampulex compressa]|nr:hypothetical protein KM043_014815 [Ampulex compressa]